MARVDTSQPPSGKARRQETDQVARVMKRYFTRQDDELCVGGVPVSQLVDKFGSPLFVYDEEVIRQKISEVRTVLPARFDLFYSIKANPNGHILNCVLNEGCGLEVASWGELFQALAAGCAPDRIIFAGPGKSEAELAAAIDASIREIHVESLEEARFIDRLAGHRGVICPVALRINPTDASGGAMRMGGKASPFGIDEEDLDAVLGELVTCQNIKIRGVHLFMGTQILDADVLINQYQRAVSIAKRIASRVGPLDTIDFGGGWGTPYFSHEPELDLEAVAAGIKDVEAALANEPLLADASAIIEPGRFLINEAGVYVAKVTRVKHSRGKTFAIIDGGMHHHLAASGNLGQAIKRNFPVAVLNKLSQAPLQATEVVGPLCTPLDTIGRGVELPAVEAGDLIGVFLSGAYARSSSPLGFLSHATPPEVIVRGGESKLIRRRGEAQDHLRDQIALDRTGQTEEANA